MGTGEITDSSQPFGVIAGGCFQSQPTTLQRQFNIPNKAGTFRNKSWSVLLFPAFWHVQFEGGTGFDFFWNILQSDLFFC